jgi:hypothetical protein
MSALSSEISLENKITSPKMKQCFENSQPIDQHSSPMPYKIRRILVQKIPPKGEYN